MVLSDRTIKAEIAAGRIVIDPYDESLVQPSSIDVRVDSKFRVFHNARYPYIDVRQPMDDLTELVEVDGEEPFILHPGEFVLGQTLESIALPDDIVARLEGKSSLGRLGLLIHSTAGFVDPSLGGQPDARALQRRQPADHDLLRDADRPDLLHADGRAGGAPLRRQRAGASTRARPSRLPPASTATSNRRNSRLRHGSVDERYHCGSSRRMRRCPASEPLEIVLILIVALIVFGPKRLPELGRSMGRGIREFKNSVTGDKDDDDDESASSSARRPPTRNVRSRARSSTTAGRSATSAAR